ncbi:MAG: DUF5686 family protein, partial [Bacteroidota bacterium]
FGWATGDRQWKYGGSLQLHPFRNNFVRLHLDYQYDLIESGFSSLYSEAGSAIYDKPNQQMPPRRFNVGILEYEERFRADLIFPNFLRNVHHRVRMQHSDVNPWYEYSFQGLERYQLTDLVVDTRIGIDEKYIRTDRGLFLKGTQWPVITLRYTHGFDNLLGSDFAYNKLEGVWFQTIPIKGFGRFSYQLTGGELLGDLPLSRLHPFQSNGQASIFSDYYVMNAMPYNTFYGSRYGTANLHLNIENSGWPHPKWAPDPMIAYGFAIGELANYNDNPEHQSEWTLQAPDQGYHEVGLEPRAISTTMSPSKSDLTSCWTRVNNSIKIASSRALARELQFQTHAIIGVGSSPRLGVTHPVKVWDRDWCFKLFTITGQSCFGRRKYFPTSLSGRRSSVSGIT